MMFDVDSVLSFWFEELDRRQWFFGGDALDAEIRSRFLAAHEYLSVHSGEIEGGAGDDARRVLAAIIVLDQFSRQLFRGSGRAFASDAEALRLARALVASGGDVELTDAQRMFVYLPFEHSENAADQEEAVRLFRQLGDAASLDYALRHQEVILRFGRFPARNAALGRETTPEEYAFLEQNPDGFAPTKS